MIQLTRIPLAGVIGSPIAHSKSPQLHGYWLKTYGLAGHYIPMDVAQADLAEVIAALPKAGFVGCNITIPHKETVLALADIVTDRAALIGAANTLIFRREAFLPTGVDPRTFHQKALEEGKAFGLHSMLQRAKAMGGHAETVPGCTC